MSRPRVCPENHLVGRTGWLRAAVLGANDGIISIASLISRRCRVGRHAKRCLDRGRRGTGGGAM